ncbi:MAG: SusC/RagA family TonB-linked outer membrane protein [Prevotellaceae bacterium]|jgi:TonB-linked SusC/RagA family outer membrane protein|nr:SusC/RagA family TonB-linked outer membrane protein [Prevotellaceae bacterium]
MDLKNKEHRLKNRLLHAVACALIMLPAGLFAQTGGQNVVRGTVSDNAGALFGVTVLVQGTTNATTTDTDGNYTITVTGEGAVLAFSYIGYKTVTQPVGTRSRIDVMMEEEISRLEDVVVVGYGTQRKADLTSAISVLDAAEVLKVPGGIENALQGNVAGVNVSGGKIRIRGTSSITGNTDPLWVVDGIIGGAVPNEHEIETIQVLKDAASAAIYGVRGANGVIVVTTKRGHLGTPKIDFNTYIGTGSPAKKIKMLNAYDYAVYVNELFYNAATPQAQADGTWNAVVPPNNASPSKPLADTDWWDEYFYPNFYQNYDLAVGGGSELVNYRLGATLTLDKRKNIPRSSNGKNLYAIVQGTKGRFTYGGRVQLSYNDNRTTSSASLQNTLQLPSNEPVYDENNKDVNRGYYQTGMVDGMDIPNQAFFIHEDKTKSQSLSAMGNIFGEVRIMDWLKFKLTYTNALSRSGSQHFRPRFVLASGGGGGVQDYNLLETTNTGYGREMFEALLSFDKKIGAHSISGVAGVTSETFKSFNKSFSGRSQEMTDFGVENKFQDNVTSTGSESANAYYSILARVMYSYAGKYMFTANFRADESSKFAEGNRWGYFPSFSIGWRISDESWMKEWSSTWLNSLKLRATLGWIGSDLGVGNYAYQAVVSSVGYFYTFGPFTGDDNMAPSNYPAARPATITNRDLSWETTRDAGFGFDLSVLKNKLTVTFDYYNREVSDMLLNVQLPLSAGNSAYFANPSVMMNIGTMTNWGIELQGTWRDNIGDFVYAISPNFSFYRNKVTNIGNTDFLAGGSTRFNGANVTQTTVGLPVAQFWGLKTDGLFQTDAEAANYVNANGQPLQPAAAAGDIKYLDLDGNGSIGEEDKTYIGSSIPDISVGLNIYLQYKGLDFSMLWQGDLGIDVYNNWKQTLLAGRAVHNQMDDIKNAFRAKAVTFTTSGGETITLPANTNTSIPRIVNGDPNQNSMRSSDYYIEDASYIRCNNITLGYTLPKNVLSKITENIRIYIGVKNPFTITGYSMFDPQVPNTGTTLDRGVDGQFYDFTGTYWSQREFFAGLQLTF